MKKEEMETAEIIGSLMTRMLSREYLEHFLRIGLRRRKEEKNNDITRQTRLEGVEAYLYMSVTDAEGVTFTVRPPVQALEISRTTPEEAWEMAERNTFRETVIESMEDFVKKEQPDAVPGVIRSGLYVITTERKKMGAAAVLDVESVRRFAEEHGIEKAFIIPSSVHECLMLPYREGLEPEYMNKIIKLVNSEEVAPEEQLGDMACMVDFT